MPSRGFNIGSSRSTTSVIAGLFIAFVSIDGIAAMPIDDEGVEVSTATPACCTPVDPLSMRLTGVSRTQPSPTDDVAER